MVVVHPLPWPFVRSRPPQEACQCICLMPARPHCLIGTYLAGPCNSHAMWPCGTGLAGPCNSHAKGLRGHAAQGIGCLRGHAAQGIGCGRLRHASCSCHCNSRATWPHVARSMPGSGVSKFHARRLGTASPVPARPWHASCWTPRGPWDPPGPWQTPGTPTAKAP